MLAGFERIGDFRAGDGRTKRETVGDAFGGAHDVGFDAVVFDGEHLAAPPETALHFVADEQDAVLVGNSAQLLEIRHVAVEIDDDDGFRSRRDRALVDGIRYRRIGDEVYYAQELFEQEELTGYLKNMLAAKKSVYEQVVYDSSGVERSFAEELEKNEAVKVYVNGEMFPRDKAMVSVFDSGFALGDGVWEGLRLVKGKLISLEAHLDRLFEGARSIDLDIGLDRAGVTKVVTDTLARNGMTDGAHIRLMITRGTKKTPNQDPRFVIGPPTIVCVAEYKTPIPEAKAKATRAKPMLELSQFQPVIQAIIELAEVAAKEPWALPEPSEEEKTLKARVDALGRAGIAEAYTPEQMVGRTIAIVFNLKPAKLMGIESNGMVLAASVEGGLPTLVGFERDVPPGARVR